MKCKECDYYRRKYHEELLKRQKIEEKLREFFGWIHYEILDKE